MSSLNIYNKTGRNGLGVEGEHLSHFHHYTLLILQAASFLNDNDVSVTRILDYLLFSYCSWYNKIKYINRVYYK
jgi:hypothetical protein